MSKENAFTSTMERLRERKKNKMQISLNALIRILHTAYPISQITIEESHSSVDLVWIRIPPSSIEGTGSCMYDFRTCMALGMEIHWMKLVEDNFHSSIARMDEERQKEITRIDMDSAHEREWTNYLANQEVEKEAEENEKLDLLCEAAYELEKAQDDGWPISDDVFAGIGNLR